MTQDTKPLAHTCEIIFANRKAPKHHILSMTFPKIGLDIPVTSRTSGSGKHLQKTACVQSDIHMKTSQAHACCQEKWSCGIVYLLGQYQLLKCYIDIRRQDDLTSSFMFESVQGISGQNNNPGWLSSSNSMCQVSSTTKKAWEGDLQIMVVDGPSWKIILLTKLSYLLSLLTLATIRLYCHMQLWVTSETDKNWVWFRYQLEQDFQRSFVLVENYTRGIDSQQLQDDIMSSGC